jgi:hypothetical protein
VATQITSGCDANHKGTKGLNAVFQDKKPLLEQGTQTTILRICGAAFRILGPESEHRTGLGMGRSAEWKKESARFGQGRQIVIFKDAGPGEKLEEEWRTLRKRRWRMLGTASGA